MIKRTRLREPGESDSYRLVGALLIFTAALSLGISPSGVIFWLSAINGIAASLFFLALYTRSRGWFAANTLTIGLGVVGVAGFAFYDLYKAAPLVHLLPTLSPEAQYDTLRIFLLASFGTAAGTLLSRGSRARRPESSNKLAARIERFAPWLLLFCSICLAALAVGYGLETLWSRPVYLQPARIKALKTFGQIFLLPALGVLGLLSTSKRPAVRLVGAALLLLFFAYAFARATRFIAVIPLAVLAGRSVLPPRPRAPTLVAVSLVTILMWPLPLMLRRQANHGFEPYSAALVTSPGDLYLFDAVEVTGNIFVSFPLVTQTVRSTSADAPRFVLASLDPTPGSPFYRRLEPRLNYIAFGDGVGFPFNGLGMIAATGWPATLAVFVVAGYALASMQRRLDGRPVIGLAFQLGTLGLLYSLLQYQLRVSVRAIELLILFALVASVADYRPPVLSRTRDNPKFAQSAAS